MTTEVAPIEDIYLRRLLCLLRLPWKGDALSLAIVPNKSLSDWLELTLPANYLRNISISATPFLASRLLLRSLCWKAVIYTRWLYLWRAISCL